MQPKGINAREFAENARALLSEDPRRYRNFGVYWYFVKALLARFYDRHNLYFLLGYEDPDVIRRVPEGLTLPEMLAAAANEYEQNARFRLGSNRLEDDDGETFTLIDPDVEG